MAGKNYGVVQKLKKIEGTNSFLSLHSVPQVALCKRRFKKKQRMDTQNCDLYSCKSLLPL